MEKIIFFDNVVSVINIQPYVDLEILETEDKDYFKIESDLFNDLNIDNSSDELRIVYNNQPSLGKVVGAFTDFFVKGDIEQLKELETPSSKVKIKVFTKNSDLKVRINKGVVSVKKDLLELDVKANHLHNFMLQSVKKLALKVNHGNISLQLCPDITSWNIKLNGGNLNINKSGNECSYVAQVNGERHTVGFNPKINIHINSGILKFDGVDV